MGYSTTGVRAAAIAVAIGLGLAGDGRSVTSDSAPGMARLSADTGTIILPSLRATGLLRLAQTNGCTQGDTKCGADGWVAVCLCSTNPETNVSICHWGNTGQRCQ